MKFALFSGFLTFSAWSVSSVNGQAFGVGKKKPGSTFQELNEQAKTAGGAGGMGDMDELMRQMGIDPEEMQKLADEMGGMDFGGLDEAMKMMAEMDPEELAKQMQEAMELFTGDDMMANMLGSQEEIIKMLEESGTVGPDEIAKFKADPEYFEQKMKESMEQMKEMLADPQMMANAAQGMKAAQDLLTNPNAMNDAMADMMKDLTDDDIESVRQMLMGGDSDPMMKELFGAIQSDELDEILKDPAKWRETVKEGFGMLGGPAGGNKIVGEL